MPVDVVRSKRRKRTAQAYFKDGRLRVLVPFGLDPNEEARIIDDLVARVGRKTSAGRVDLDRRARALAKRYGLAMPRSIEWSDRQMRRWGSCTPGDRSIRISNRLASMPGWVLDWVLVHELAHLEEPNHGARFKELVERYELAERAKGYLMAMGERHQS